MLFLIIFIMLFMLIIYIFYLTTKLYRRLSKIIERIELAVKFAPHEIHEIDYPNNKN